jgi:enamidase
VTYAEAAAIGIDNLEHGFLASTDFVKNKKPDECPPDQVTQASLASMDSSGSAEKALIADLVKRNVAVTSTLTVFETFVPGRPVPPGLDVLEPQLESRFRAIKASIDKNTASPWTTIFQKGREMEVAFANAGGLLIAGTDPTGYGGVIPGFSNQREIELLVESGFSPVEAIKICTLNGATYLGRADSIGSIAPGKQADLVIINGDPSSNISDIRKVETVFKKGVGYDSAKLIASVKGKVGLF